MGKTELCRALAEAMFSDEDAMIRLDMSEYMEPHSVAKLTGSPPLRRLRRRRAAHRERSPQALLRGIVRFEIEKRTRTFNILLQVLEDGRLTDAKGRSGRCNTILIMTSNVGAMRIKAEQDRGFRRGVRRPALV